MATINRITNAYAAEQILAEARLRFDLHPQTVHILSRSLRQNGEYWRSHAEFARTILELGDQYPGMQDFTVMALAVYLIKLGDGYSHDAITAMKRYSHQSS